MYWLVSLFLYSIIFSSYHSDWTGKLCNYCSKENWSDWRISWSWWRHKKMSDYGTISQLYYSSIHPNCYQEMQLFAIQERFSASSSTAPATNFWQKIKYFSLFHTILGGIRPPMHLYFRRRFATANNRKFHWQFFTKLQKMH